MSHSAAHASQISAHSWHNWAAQRDPRDTSVTHTAQIAAQSRHNRAQSAIFASLTQQL
ncbi:hypothetical protein L842_5707 [Mycobacterium intracellulare MIN_052511_1280]|nr:hypothetical protein L842_5690 [Mycobacterium intracellulare MIN_052511_1280]ETZ40477.1 hypothetical protein L842_5707 [Mycobacterium intracellulare MIN_052511_1280]